VRETGVCDIFKFLGPPARERAKGETGGAQADQWVLKRREFPGPRGCGYRHTVNDITPTSLGYPISVYNQNSTLTGKDRGEI